MKMTGIYSIKSPSGKIYIGQSRNIKSRFRDHRTTRFPYCRYLNNSIKKYGSGNHVFEILHELPNDVEQSVLDSYEILYMDFCRTTGFELLNIKEGGLSGRHSEETKKRIGEAGKGRKPTENAISLLRERSMGNKYALGVIHSDETRKKMSIAQKSLNKTISEEQKQKFRLKVVGRKQSTGEVEKRRLKLIGKKRTREQRKNISEGLINHPSFSKPIIQTSEDNQFIKEWPSISEASRHLNMHRNNINNVLLNIGDRKSAGGFKWKYV